MTATKFTFHPYKLAAALESATLVAKTADKDKPILRSIALDIGDAGVRWIATDSYRLLTGTFGDAPTMAGHDGPTVLLMVEDAERLAKMLKGAGLAAELELAANIDGNDMTVEVPTAGVFMARLLDAEFPRWRELVPIGKCGPRDRETLPRFNPEFLATMAGVKVAKGMKTVKIGTTNEPWQLLNMRDAYKPVVWTASDLDGDKILYLLMPVRPK